jgi:hypothetical protein
MDRLLKRIVEANKALLGATLFGQREKLFFRCFDLLPGRRVYGRIIGDIDHVLANADQHSPQGQLIDHASIIDDVDDAGRIGMEPQQIGRHAHLADGFIGGEIGLHRDRRCHFASANELGDRCEDFLVRREIEMVRL